MRCLLTILLICLAGTTATAELKLFPERKEACLQCHGADGVSPTPETPSLGGLSEFYALVQLVDFRDGNRKSDIMREVVRGMTDDDLRAAAALVSEQPRLKVLTTKAVEARMQRGQALAASVGCRKCHGAELLGDEQMPPLRNQREDYLLKAMQDYKNKLRLGDRADMVEIVAPFNDAQLADIAHYLAHLTPIASQQKK